MIVLILHSLAHSKPRCKQSFVAMFNSHLPGLLCSKIVWFHVICVKVLSKSVEQSESSETLYNSLYNICSYCTKARATSSSMH